MSIETSELIALSCPDLTSIESRENGSKHLTATEYIAKSAAAATEAIALKTKLASKLENVSIIAEKDTNRSKLRTSVTCPILDGLEAHFLASQDIAQSFEQASIAKNETLINASNFNNTDVMVISPNGKRSVENGQTPFSDRAINSEHQKTKKNQSRTPERTDFNNHRMDREQNPSPNRSLSEDRNENAVHRMNRERSQAPDRLNSSSASSGSMNTRLSTSLSRQGSGSNSIPDHGVYTITKTASTTSLPSLPIPSSSDSIPIEQPKLSFTDSKIHSVPAPPRPPPTSSILTTKDGIIVHGDTIGMSIDEIQEIVETTVANAITSNKRVHRTKTPPPVGVKLGVNLKRVTPPRTHITVKKNEGPMLGVVLRKVEKKTQPQKSILDDDKPLYHISIVRSDNKPHHPAPPKPKPKPAPVPLQKTSTVATMQGVASAKPGATSAAVSKTFIGPGGKQMTAAQYAASLRQPGVPITIQKIEGDKIIIIKKIQIPKNSKIPEQYRQVCLKLKTIVAVLFVCA